MLSCTIYIQPNDTTRAIAQVYAKATMDVAAAVVPAYQQLIADERNRRLTGFPGWCRPAATPFHRASSNKKRLRKPWNFNRRHLWALRVNPAF